MSECITYTLADYQRIERTSKIQALGTAGVALVTVGWGAFDLLWTQDLYASLFLLLWWWLVCSLICWSTVRSCLQARAQIAALQAAGSTTSSACVSISEVSERISR